MFKWLEKYITLKEAAKISGYASDYIGCLIRKGEIKGRKTYGNSAWFVNKKDLLAYKKKGRQERRNLIYDIIPPIQEKVSSWLRAFQLFLKTSKYATISIFLAVVIFGALVVLAFPSKPPAIKIYPVQCQGGWENSQNAQGEPDLTSGASGEEFNEQNSAVLRDSISQIFCGGFKSEIPSDTELKKVSLRFSWTFKKEDTKIIDLSSVSPVQEIKIEEKKEREIIEESEPLPVSEPESNPEPLPPSSFWQRIINYVFAQEDNQNIPEEFVLNQSNEEILTPETIIEPSLIIEPLSLPSEPILNDAFLEILYTFDGENWQSLGKVSQSNWKNLILEIPITNWEDLKNIQIKIQSLMVFDSQPIIYLDGLWLEAEYEKISIEEKEKVFELLKKDFQANEEPEFILPKIEGPIKIKQAILINPDNQEITVDIVFSEEENNYRIKIKKIDNWQPGKYIFELKFEQAGQVYKARAEFNWLEIPPSLKQMFSFSFSLAGKPIKTERVLEWHPENFRLATKAGENLKINLEIVSEISEKEKESKLVLNGRCLKDYFVILIYPREEDYNKNPAGFVYNKAFPCQNGSYHYEFNDLPKSLSDGIYYLLVAEQGKEGPWQPITAIQPIKIELVYK